MVVFFKDIYFSTSISLLAFTFIALFSNLYFINLFLLYNCAAKSHINWASQEIIKRHLQMVLFIKTFHTSSHVHAGESPCRLWRKYKEKVVEKMFCFIQTIDYLTNVPTDSSLWRCHAKRTSRTDWLTDMWPCVYTRWTHWLTVTLPLAASSWARLRGTIGHKGPLQAPRDRIGRGRGGGRRREMVGSSPPPSFPSRRRPHPPRVRWASRWLSGGLAAALRQWLLVPASDRWWERAGG